jgi:hypothetical protein
MNPGVKGVALASARNPEKRSFDCAVNQGEETGVDSGMTGSRG